jgi:hypothetical protein
MSSTQKPQMELGLSVVQGATTEQHNGQPIKHWVSLTKAAAGRLRNFLDAVGLAPDAEGGFDDSELIGRQFMGEIFEDEYQKGINLDGTPKIKTSIKIRKERPVEGAAPEAAPAPTPTAPTRPAVPVAPAKPKQPLPPGLPRVASSPPPPAGQRIPLPRR